MGEIAAEIHFAAQEVQASAVDSMNDPLRLRGPGAEGTFRSLSLSLTGA
ncbi:hypothetical protein [Aromatoleum buckelii]|uniref:Uncharacterized protein n=1 Tax=Aromatoleum buckelii TaxID=200254 RepID=A0ABX1N5H3_9RHOO|nr:hypothetical protein [Aromatoleum buckelii]MCK0510633.1 hypothetical protein [Aromatoleum buckelii]